MNINDSGISETLKKIRERIGGEPVDWIPKMWGQIDEETGPDYPLDRLFSESGLLIKYGQPVFVYIRDHTVGGPFLDAKGRRKIHFAVCRTLIEMSQKGRFNRYKITNRSDDQYLIDVQDGWGGRSKEETVTLYPCQNCLETVGYKCFRRTLPRRTLNEIVVNFKAKEALDLLSQQFEIFRKQMSDVKPATQPTGYPANWKKIADRIKKVRGYICEKCHVDLSRNKRLLDAHHIDGEKQNVFPENIRVLCKICHSEEHPHYPVSFLDREQIMYARKRTKKKKKN